MAVLFTHIFLFIHKIDLTLTYGELLTFAAIIATAGEAGIKADKTKKLCIETIARYSANLMTGIKKL